MSGFQPLLSPSKSKPLTIGSTSSATASRFAFPNTNGIMKSKMGKKKKKQMAFSCPTMRFVPPAPPRIRPCIDSAEPPKLLLPPSLKKTFHLPLGAQPIPNSGGSGSAAKKDNDEADFKLSRSLTNNRGGFIAPFSCPTDSFFSSHLRAQEAQTQLQHQQSTTSSLAQQIGSGSSTSSSKFVSSFKPVYESDEEKPLRKQLSPPMNTMVSSLGTSPTVFSMLQSKSRSASPGTLNDGKRSASHSLSQRFSGMSTHSTSSSTSSSPSNATLQKPSNNNNSNSATASSNNNDSTQFAMDDELQFSISLGPHDGDSLLADDGDDDDASTAENFLPLF
jgi:hypothetical protein